MTLTLAARREYGPDAMAVLSPQDVADALAAVAGWPGYRPTSFAARPGLARALGVASVRLKLEGERFEPRSFKSLGPPYALARERRRRQGPLTAVAATSGNHGRALAWGARQLGCGATIFMAAHASQGREDAIRSFGAEVVRVPGAFANAERAAREAGERPGHVLVADLPVAGSDAVPRDILAGYTVVGSEIAQAGEMPTHVFVAAGNGTLAAAVGGALAFAHGAERPKVIAVEPESSDAVRRSLAADAPARIDAPMESVMDGLVVAAASRIAWPVLRAVLDAGMTVPDATAVDTLRRLARDAWGDAKLAVGETGIAAPAALVLAASDPELRARLGIDGGSRLAAIACEGVTDQAVYDALVR